MFQNNGKIRLSSGKGTSQYRLVAFDNALIDAGISNYNLVRVSSILPGESKKQSNVDLPFGVPLHTAYATISSDRKGQHTATAIAVGIPKNREKYKSLKWRMIMSRLHSVPTATNLLFTVLAV